MRCCWRRHSMPPSSLPFLLLLLAFPACSSSSSSSPSPTTCDAHQSTSAPGDCAVAAEGPIPPNPTCAQLRLQLPAAAQGSDASQTWIDLEPSQRCHITFDKPDAAVTYTVGKELLQQLASVLTQHAQHGGTASAQLPTPHEELSAASPTQDSRSGSAADSSSSSSSSSRIKAFLGLASDDMKVLVAALSLNFPRIAMGWQAFELLTREAALEPLTSSFTQRPETKAQHSAGDQRCETLLCTWQRMVQQGKSPSLEQLLHLLLTQPADAPPSPSPAPSTADPGPRAEQEAAQQPAPGGDPSQSLWPQAWQASAAPPGHGAIRSSTGSGSASGSESGSMRRPPLHIDMFQQGLLLTHLSQLFEELLLWDLLYWMMWYCCPSMMVAYNAITSLAPDQPLLVLYICTVAALQALTEWRLGLSILWASYRRDEAALIRQSLASAGTFCYTMPASLLSGLLLTLGVGLVGDAGVKWLLLLLLLAQPVVVVVLRGRMWVRLEGRYRSAQARTQRHQQQAGAGAAPPPPPSARSAAHHRPHAGAPPGWVHRTATAHQLPARPAGQPTAGPPPAAGRLYPSPRLPDSSAAPPLRSTSLASLPEVHWPPPLDYPSWLEDEPDLPDAFRCPITLTLMREPTSASSGLTYERKAIFQWLQLHRVDPVCQVPLKRHRLTPNLNLRHMLENWAGGKLAEQRRQEGKVLAALREDKDRAGKGGAGAEQGEEAAAAAAAAVATEGAAPAVSAAEEEGQ